MRLAKQAERRSRSPSLKGGRSACTGTWQRLDQAGVDGAPRLWRPLETPRATACTQFLDASARSLVKTSPRRSCRRASAVSALVVLASVLLSVSSFFCAHRSAAARCARAARLDGFTGVPASGWSSKISLCAGPSPRDARNSRRLAPSSGDLRCLSNRADVDSEGRGTLHSLSLPACLRCR